MGSWPLLSISTIPASMPSRPQQPVAMAAPQVASPAGHRRNKSSSVLKSIIVSKNHKRSPSDGTALNSSQPDSRPYNPLAGIQTTAPLLPPDHPHSQLRTADWAQNSPTNPPSPRKSQDTRESPRKGLHKKTLSSVSLRSLGKEKEKSQLKAKQLNESTPVLEDAFMGTKTPKKTKSSAKLSTIFNNVKSPKKENTPMSVPAAPPKDKENTTPPSSATAAGPIHTPIWAQFSSQPFQEVTTTSKVPLNDRQSIERRSIEEEIALYTPSDYSPSKQRNFFEYGQPSLQKRPVAKERPKSTFLPGSTSHTSLFETLGRKKSNERAPLSVTKGNEGRSKDAVTKETSSRSLLRRTSSDNGKRKDDLAKQAQNGVKKQNRVMAAVAAFNGKSKETQARPASPNKLDPKVVDAEFEDVLVSLSCLLQPRKLIFLGIQEHPTTSACSDANADNAGEGRLHPYS